MRTVPALAAASAALLALAPWAPQWLVFLLALALAKGLVVLGLLLLMRAGLVSFGQGLYFGLGAYAAALLAHRGGLADAALMIVAGTLGAAAVAALVGLLVKSSTLGSTDGFSVHVRHFAGVPLAAGAERRIFYAASVLAVFALAWAMHRWLGSHWGRVTAAIRDNELRVEYLGASVYRVVYVNYIVAGALAGLGGAFAALAVGHVDPETAYWTTSGEFVFIAILGGTGNVLAPFLAAIIFEALRTVANQYAPNVWQMALGLAMLAIILFLPGGLWTLARRKA
jgi:branched-chain amino acid transport system permease protein